MVKGGNIHGNEDVRRDTLYDAKSSSHSRSHFNQYFHSVKSQVTSIIRGWSSTLNALRYFFNARSAPSIASSSRPCSNRTLAAMCSILAISGRLASDQCIRFAISKLSSHNFRTFSKDPLTIAIRASKKSDSTFSISSQSCPSSDRINVKLS